MRARNHGGEGPSGSPPSSHEEGEHVSTIVTMSFVCHGDNEENEVTNMAVSLAKDLRSLDGVLAVYIRGIDSEGDWQQLRDRDDIVDEMVLGRMEQEERNEAFGAETRTEVGPEPQTLTQRTAVIHE